MEAKEKNARTVDRVRSILFQSGLVISLALVLLAFEWKQVEMSTFDFSGTLITSFEDEKPPVTVQKDPVIKQPKEVFKLLIVPHNDPIETPEFLTNEIGQLDQLPRYIPPDDQEEPGDPNGIFDFVKIEDKPSFVGGEAAMYKFLNANLEYPKVARATGITGQVVIGFIVDKEGNVKDVSILKDIGGGCGAEAARVVKMMPRWIPGKQRKRPVKVRMSIPVNFRLQSK